MNTTQRAFYTLDVEPANARANVLADIIHVEGYDPFGFVFPCEGYDYVHSLFDAYLLNPQAQVVILGVADDGEHDVWLASFVEGACARIDLTEDEADALDVDAERLCETWDRLQERAYLVRPLKPRTRGA